MNSIPGYLSASVIASPAEALANANSLRSSFQTELRFTVGKSLSLKGRIGQIKNFMVAGPSMTAGGGGGGGININGYTSFDTIASVLSNGSCLGISPNATFSGNNLWCCGAGVFAIGLAHSSNLLVSGYFSIAQANSDGIQAAHGAIIQISGGYHIHGCAGNGIHHWGASSVHAQNGLITICSLAGIQTNSANSWVYGTNVSTCNQGFACSVGGQMDCDNCVTAAITSGDYVCSHGAYMYAASFQNPSAQFSPARNTFGNGGAYIEG